MNTVLSKYFLYIKSISTTGLEQDLDVQELSHKLGLGNPEPVLVAAEKSMEGLSTGQSLQYPASPATTLWRAAASQWQQASSQWHETARWTPRLRESPQTTANSPVFSPATVITATKVASCSPAGGMSCGTPDLECQLKQKFLSRTNVCGSRSVDRLLSGNCEQSSEGRRHTVAATRSDLIKECYETHRKLIPGCRSSMAPNESVDVTSPDVMDFPADFPSRDAQIDLSSRIHRSKNTRYVHVHKEMNESPT